MSKNQTDKDGFMEAIENDEYAEFVLNGEDPELILITDWEGDHFINPYVIIPEGYEDNEEVWELITDNFPEFGDIHTELVEDNEQFNYIHVDTKNRYPRELDY
jgi:hypothetical protein